MKTTNRQVLVIDDDPVIRALLEDCLILPGITVLTTSNWNDGKKLLSANSVDLLILDFQMPDIRGDAIVEELGEHDMKVIVLSGNEDVKDILNDKELHVDLVLRKPFSIPDLSARVVELLK